MIKQVVTNLRMMPVSGVSIALRQALDAQGDLVATPGMHEAAKEMLDELLRLAEALEPLRVPR